MDVEKFVRHLCRLVLRHQMPVWNYFVNSFYSVCLSKLDGGKYKNSPPTAKTPAPRQGSLKLNVLYYH
jgi:hypothetical protein